MGKGAGRSVASAPAVLALLAREAAGAPALAWVSWDDLDAPPAAARATLYPDPGPSAVSEPAAAAHAVSGADWLWCWAGCAHPKRPSTERRCRCRAKRARR